MRLFEQKLEIPMIALQALPRPAVLETITTALTSGHSILFVAPAGWGKTTALALWARSQPADATPCWYTLDSGDDDPLVFLHYLLAALTEVCPALQAVLTSLRSTPEQWSLQSLIERTISTLCAHERPIYLIMDGVDVAISGDPVRSQPIFDLISLLIRYSPLQLMLASRTAIPGVAHLRAQGRLQILECSTLAFLADDIAELARIRYQTSCSAEQVIQLRDHVAGWPALVTLALDDWYQRRRTTEQAAEILPLSSSSLSIFLAEQIFAPLPPHLQTFLLEMAVLDELTAERCSLLCDAGPAAPLLNELYSRRLLVALRPGWFNYLAPLHSFARAKLWEDPMRARELLRRAATLYQAGREPNAAMERWLQLGDVAAATALILSIGPTFRSQGQREQLRSWIEELQSRAPLSPQLLLVLIQLAMDTADWPTALAALQQVLVSSDPVIVTQAQLLEVRIACLRREVRHASELLEHIQPEALSDGLRADYYEMAGRVAMCCGQFDKATALLKQALACYSPNTCISQETNKLPYLYDLLGWVMTDAGDRSGARSYLGRAEAAWQASGNQPARVSTLNNLAVLALEDGWLDEARTHLDEGMRIATTHHCRREHVVLMCGQADLALLEVRLELAIERYTQAYHQAKQMQMLAEAAYAAAGALRAAALAGADALVSEWQRVLDSLSSVDTEAYQGQIALARGLAATTNTEAAFYLEQTKDSQLTSYDQAQLLMLQAQLAFRQSGWGGAAVYWHALDQQATNPSIDNLLHCQIRTTAGLLVAAGDSPFARRLRTSGGTRIPCWEFYALGGFAVVCNGLPSMTVVRPIDQLVLIRLLESGSSGLSALMLWDDVWGDQPFSSDALRQSLSRLRRSTNLPILLHQGHCQIQIAWSTLFYDALMVESELPRDETLQASVCERMLELYRGPFLGHLQHESRWLAVRRTALRRRALYIRERLAQAIEQTQPQRALQLYSSVLDEDGCREQAAVGAMRCAMQVGDRVLAISIYQQVCTHLVSVIGADPSPLLLQLYQQIA